MGLPKNNKSNCFPFFTSQFIVQICSVVKTNNVFFSCFDDVFVFIEK